MSDCDYPKISHLSGLPLNHTTASLIISSIVVNDTVIVTFLPLLPLITSSYKTATGDGGNADQNSVNYLFFEKAALHTAALVNFLVQHAAFPHTLFVSGNVINAYCKGFYAILNLRKAFQE